jgi:hypothetical protein
MSLIVKTPLRQKLLYALRFQGWLLYNLMRLYRLDFENISILSSNGITNSHFQTNLTILFSSRIGITCENPAETKHKKSDTLLYRFHNIFKQQTLNGLLLLLFYLLWGLYIGFFYRFAYWLHNAATAYKACVVVSFA